MDWSDLQTNLRTINSRWSFPIYGNLHGTRIKQPNDNPKGDDHYKRNGHYKYLPAVIALLFAMPANAESVGGVSATASPVANSFSFGDQPGDPGFQGPYITNTYGGGIQCQGETINVTPFLTGSVSAQKPFEDYWDSPVYDMTTDDDGNLNNPGDILYYVPTRTGQKDNINISFGVSATWSVPQDRKLQDQCKEAAATQIALQKQLTANKRLDFEIARLKNCGNLLKEGIRFHKKSPYYKICADVVVEGVNTIKPHVHPISATSLGGPLTSPSRVGSSSAPK